MMKYWLFIGLGLFVPQLVLAANPLDFTPPADDLSIYFLGSIFGVVDGVLSGSGSQILGQMFGIFNAAVLAIGGIILLYVTIVSTLNTANEGEFLGKKWSSIWIPVRAVIGVALLIPKQSGYCLMQIFVMWIVVQGVGAADKVWGAALDYMAAGGKLVNETPFPNLFRQGSPTVEASSNMLLAQTCLIALHRFLEETRKNNTENGLCPAPGDPKAPWWCKNIPNFSNDVGAALMQAGQGGSQVAVPMPNLDKNAYSEIHGVCGEINIAPYVLEGEDADQLQGQARQVDQMRVVAATQVFLNLGSVAQKVIRNQFDRQTPSELGEVSEIKFRSGKTVDLTIFARNEEPKEKTVRTWKASSGSALLNGKEVIDASNVYARIVEPALRGVIVARKTSKDSISLDFINQAKTEGWILAGAYFYDLVKLNKKYNSSEFSVYPDDGALVVNFEMKKISSDNENFSKLTTRQGRDKPAALTPTQLNQLNAILAGGEWIEKDGHFEVIKRVQGSDSIIGHIEQVKKMSNMGNPYENKAPSFDLDLSRLPDSPSTPFKLPEVKIKAGWFNIVGGVVTLFYNEIILRVMNLITGVVIDGLSVLVDYVLGMPLKIVADTFELALQASLKANANPISILAGFGAVLMNLAINSWLASILFAGSFAAVAAFATGGVLAVFMGLAPLVFSMLTAIFLSGAMLAFYLPLIPYIIFLFGALAWFIGVIESMVAAPIVALGVMHPEGHEAFGKSDNAIMLILNVFLRPSMMVIGFIAGIVLSYVGLWMLNFAFDRVVMGVVDLTFESALGTGMFGSEGMGSVLFAPMVAKVLMMVVYITLVMTIIQKSFSLIHYVPDKVLRWLSGGLQEQLGSSTTESGAQEAQGMARQVAGMSAQMASKTSHDSAQGAMDKLKESSQASLSGKKGEGDEDKGGDDSKGGGGGTAQVSPQQQPSTASGDSGGSGAGGGSGASGSGGSGSSAGVSGNSDGIHSGVNGTKN